MNFCTACIVLLCGVSGLAHAGADSPADTSRFNKMPEYYNVLYSRGAKMNPGMENILTANRLSELTVDGVIGNSWFPEDGTLGKMGGVAGRIAKNYLVDVPIDHFSVVFAHEYFGHGARYRELSVDDIDYGYEAPPPYGDGGGYASASIEDPISDDELMTILIGGMETQAIINRKLNMQWMANQRMRYRESLLHYWSFRIMFDYVMDTEDRLGEDRDGKDASEYLVLLNRKAGVTDLDHPRMNVSDLKSRLWINMANPFSLYALYSVYKTYLWDGKTTSGIPMITIGQIGYLPALRMNLTPFGPEYHLENYFRFDSKVVLLDLRVGDNTFYNSWGGAGLSIQNFYQDRRLSIDFDLLAWKQPGVELVRNTEALIGNGAGGAASFTVHYDLSEVENPLALVVQAGYKTAGYAEGFDLDASPIIMIGLGYRN